MLDGFIEGLMHDLCLMGVKSRREYFAGLASSYIKEALNLMTLIENEEIAFDVNTESTIKSDYNLARKCLKSGRKFVESDERTRLKFERDLDYISYFLGNYIVVKKIS